jgi:DNA primase
VEAFNARMGTSLPLSEYLFKALTETVDLRSAEGKATLADQVQPLLQRVTDPILRELMLARLATVTGLTQATLEPRGDASVRTVRSRIRTAQPLDRLSLTGRPVRKALALLLYEPALAGRAALPADLPELDLPGVPLLAQLLELLREDPNLRTAGQVLERFRGSAAEESLQRLAQWEPEIPVADLPAELDGVMDNLRQRLDAQRRERRRAYLVSKPLAELTDAEKSELRALASSGKRAATEVPQDFRAN